MLNFSVALPMYKAYIHERNQWVELFDLEFKDGRPIRLVVDGHSYEEGSFTLTPSLPEIVDTEGNRIYQGDVLKLRDGSSMFVISPYIVYDPKQRAHLIMGANRFPEFGSCEVVGSIFSILNAI